MLCIRRRGVEVDNGNMYVDGNKACSEVGGECVSVTEKLLYELEEWETAVTYPGSIVGSVQCV